MPEAVTKGKQAEKEMREQLRLNQILLDSFPCVALLLRPKTRKIVAMNKAAKDAGCVLGRKGGIHRRSLSRNAS